MSDGGEVAMADAGELLARYSPFIQYDSLEAYSADSPATMADCKTAANPHGNVLVHGGHELAAAGATRREAVLDLAFLHGGHYPDAPHTVAAADDYIDVIGKEYIAEAHAMHLLPGMANQVYGHAARDREGALWLQYWFFYYYNDKALLGNGRHEGDWEMIQLRIGADGEPDVVTYAQHKRGERCSWEDVEKEEGAPVVYSARGSHASYLRRGNHATEVPLAGWDYNDAGGPLVRPRLNLITDTDPSWVAWPGRWGSTRPGVEVGGVEWGDDSPVGPRRHGQWRDPLRFHEEAAAARSLAPVVGTNLVRPPSPSVAATRAGDRAGISFTFPALAGTPPLKAVLVSLDGTGDRHAPTTVLFEPPPPDGHVDFPLVLGSRAYTVRVSGVDADGLTGPVGETEMPAP
ncbi:MAG TPA: Vps62-related protein [Solirubrobacterales bacterium]